MFTKQLHQYPTKIAEFCRVLNPDEQALQVDNIPESYAVYGVCDVNVAEKIRREGGEAVFGWDIFILGDVLVEAEWHVIWRSPEGLLVDITPRPIEGEGTYFLPQPDLCDRTIFTSSKRMAMVDCQASRGLFMLGKMLDEVRRKSWDGSVWRLSKADRDAIQVRAQKIMVGVPNWSKCPCDSTKLFGKCCGRPKGTPWSNLGSSKSISLDERKAA